MTPLVLWTFAIGIVTAVACALCGVFLVVKREAFISEGLSHAVLPGIIFGFLLSSDRQSPLLIIAAALSGLLMVLAVRWLASTRLVDSDAALGIVFSGLFSIGVIASSLGLSRVHFHAHCIIDGNLALAAIDHLEIDGYDFGPKAFVTMSVVCVLLISFIFAFFKELQLMSFDESTARLWGFRPALLHTAWLGLVSLTAVAAFEIAGTVLVVALMVTPAATANLFTGRLPNMLFWSCALAVVCSTAGIFLGLYLDISYAGPVATVNGAAFLLAAVITRYGLRSTAA